MAATRDYDPSIYERSAEVYDVMNAARGKSYADESATVLRVVRERLPEVESLLDVACGTGLHLVHLCDELRVEGVEPHPRLRAIAQARLPGVSLHDGDMRTFDLGRRFDVVTCLFSAIGYMLTLDDLRAAIDRMAAHVSSGGLLVVEPWFHPEAWIDGLVMAESATTGSLAIARLSHSGREGNISHFDFHWTVGRGPTLDGSGGSEGAVAPSAVSEAVEGEAVEGEAVEQWIEPHRLALWSDAEYRDAFAAAGLEVAHDPEGLIGRGLYLGRRPC